MRSPAFAALAIVLMLAHFASGAETLKAEFRPLANRPRSEGPMLFDTKLTWPGSSLIEGVLEITYLQNAQPVCVQTTQEMALASGARTFTLLSPPIPARNGADLSARLRFLSRRGEIKLGEFQLALDRYGERNFVIAVCTPRGVGNDRLHALWQSARFERFQPEQRNATRSTGTSPVYFAPEDFPSDPYAHFAFDVVLLDAGALGALREKQLAALARWVEAGGSVCVLPGGGLKEVHVRFLNALAATKTALAPYSLDAQSRAAGPGILRAYAGFGRAVIATKPLETDTDLDQREWRAAAAFLWKYRARQGDHAAATGQWLGPSELLKYSAQAENEKSIRAGATQRLTSALLPKSTRLIPFSVITIILGAFVIVIGPADWLVLGTLRRRRWTWVLFPACAAAFTGITVAAAEHYLGGQDHEATLTVTDIGRDGSVARETKFRMHFAARNRELATEHHHGVATMSQGNSRGMYSEPAEDTPPRYEGQFPARYTLRQRLRQWTPHINRITSLEGAADPSGIEWGMLDFEKIDSFGMPSGAKELSARHTDCVFYVLHPGQTRSYFGTEKVNLSESIRVLCTPGSFKLDSIAVGSSPHGGPEWTDLQVFDPDDSAQWVVVALRQVNGDIHLYRRIFRKD